MRSSPCHVITTLPLFMKLFKLCKETMWIFGSVLEVLRKHDVLMHPQSFLLRRNNMLIWSASNISWAWSLSTVAISIVGLNRLATSYSTVRWLFLNLLFNFLDHAIWEKVKLILRILTLNSLGTFPRSKAQKLLELDLWMVSCSWLQHRLNNQSQLQLMGQTELMISFL